MKANINSMKEVRMPSTIAQRRRWREYYNDHKEQYRGYRENN